MIAVIIGDIAGDLFSFHVQKMANNLAHFTWAATYGSSLAPRGLLPFGNCCSHKNQNTSGAILVSGWNICIFKIYCFLSLRTPVQPKYYFSDGLNIVTQMTSGT